MKIIYTFIVTNAVIIKSAVTVEICYTVSSKLLIIITLPQYIQPSPLHKVINKLIVLNTFIYYVFIAIN